MPKSRKRPKKKAKPEDQHAQFAETARRLGADMDEETFKRAIGKIVKPKTEDERRG